MAAVRDDFLQIRIHIDAIEVWINEQESVVRSIFYGKQKNFATQIGHDVHALKLVQIFETCSLYQLLAGIFRQQFRITFSNARN